MILVGETAGFPWDDNVVPYSTTALPRDEQFVQRFFVRHGRFASEVFADVAAGLPSVIDTARMASLFSLRYFLL